MNIAFCQPRNKNRSNGLAKGGYYANWFEAMKRYGPEHTYFHYDPGTVEADLTRNENQLTSFLNQHKIDLFIIPVSSENPPAVWSKSWFGKTKVAVVICESLWLIQKDGRSAASGHREHALDFIGACDLALTNSETLQREIAEKTGISPDRIEVVLEGTPPLFHPVSYWRASVEKTLVIFRKVCRPKIAIILADSGDQTVVPHVLDVLLPYLCDQYDCDLFFDNQTRASSKVGITNQKLRVFGIDTFQNRVDEYTKPLYVIGHPQHVASLQGIMERYPGIVLMDSLDQDREALTALISWLQCLEESGEGIGKSMIKAENIIVHTEDAANLLRENGFHNVLISNKPVKPRVMVSMLTDPSITFASYGRVQPGDGLDLAIPCIAKLVAKGYRNVRLRAFVDRESKYSRTLKRLADLHGIGDRFELAGTPKQEQFDIQMGRTDVCLHLYKDNGSRAVSDKLLELMSYGKPIIVLDTESHRNLPDDAVCKLSGVSDEEEQLFQTMLSLIENKQLRNKIRRQARDYVTANHSISRYANQIVNLIGGQSYDFATSDDAAANPEYPSTVSDTNEHVEHVAHAAHAAHAAHVEHVEHVEQVKHVEHVENGDSKADHLPITGIPDGADSDGAIQKEMILQPSKYRRIHKGKSVQGYFSFDFAILPPGRTIKSAIMHIPVRGKKFRVHRISASWNANKTLGSKPRIRPKPIYSHIRKSAKGTAVLKWDCTELARYWQTGALGNYGVYASTVSAARKPWLSVEIH